MAGTLMFRSFSFRIEATFVSFCVVLKIVTEEWTL
jgi:hypothetical protein